MRWPIAAVLALSLASGADPSPVPYDDVTTHSALISHAITLATRDGYPELEKFRPQIKQGAIDEDGDRPIIRFVNHFFDPDTGFGMPKNWYAIVYEGRLPAYSDTTRFMNAFDWARNGMRDGKDWEDGIEAYDYTVESRKTAYLALGHVVHLLQDMAQPDHATSRPHPGGYAHDKIAGKPSDPNYGKRKAIAEYLFPQNRIGYEALWKHKTPHWPLGQTVRKVVKLYEAFSGMAKKSKDTERALGVPDAARGEMALGLRSYRSARAEPGREIPEAIGEVLTLTTDALASLWRLDQYMDFNDNLWLHFEANVPIVPTIPWPANAQTKPYIDLGNELLPLAEEWSAGLMQHFHDIVNPPAFVESVTVLQDGKKKYHARWEDAPPVDERIPRRHKVQEPCDPLELGKPAFVRVTFGPVLKVDNHHLREAVDQVKVWYEPDGARFDGPDPPDTWAVTGGGFAQDPADPTILYWQGLFNPQTQGRFRIRAQDKDAHLAGRDPDRLPLDGMPGSPARARARQNHPWEGYEPGDDLNHSLMPDARCIWCLPTEELLRTRWSADWTGTITAKEDHLRDGAVEGFIEHTVTLKFRSLANIEPWKDTMPMHMLYFGHGEGTHAVRAKLRGEPEKRREGTSTVNGNVFIMEQPGHKHPSWLVVVPHSGGVEEIAQFAPGFVETDALPTGRLSGRTVKEDTLSKLVTDWRFTFKPTEAPPHVVQCERVRRDEVRAINTYTTHVGLLVQPWMASADAAEAKSVQDMLTQGMAEWGDGTVAALNPLRNPIDDAFKEAHEMWLSQKPGNEDNDYPGKVETLKAAIDAWFAKRREGEQLLAASADRAAGVVQRKSPAIAKKLRDAAEQLRTKGSESFGSTSR